MSLSSPRGTEMFHFPRLPSIIYVFNYGYSGFTGVSCLIRKSPVKLAEQLTEAYRSLATSFFGS
jgi:hypothetical protein